MAYFLFAKAIVERTPIKLFNFGKMKRDFTYIDDVVDAVCRIADDDSPLPLQRIYNIGNNRPEELAHLVATL